MAIFIFLSVGSITNTPEVSVARNFWNFYTGKTEIIELDSNVESKLKKFGLFYNIDDFYLVRKDKIFSSFQASLKSRPYPGYCRYGPIRKVG